MQNWRHRIAVENNCAIVFIDRALTRFTKVEARWLRNRYVGRNTSRPSSGFFIDGTPFNYESPRHGRVCRMQSHFSSSLFNPFRSRCTNPASEANCASDMLGSRKRVNSNSQPVPLAINRMGR